MKTKEVILEKTFNLLLAKGFDAVSISDIKEATGLSRGLLYHYFRNKEELFVEVAEKYFVTIFDFDIEKTRDFRAGEFALFMCKRFRKILKIISSAISETRNQGEFTALNYHFLFYQVIQRNKVFRERYRKTTEKELIGWEYALRNSIADNEIRKDIDIPASAMQLFTLTDGIWFQSLFSADGRSILKSLEKSLLHYISLLR